MGVLVESSDTESAGGMERSCLAGDVRLDNCRVEDSLGIDFNKVRTIALSGRPAPRYKAY